MEHATAYAIGFALGVEFVVVAGAVLCVLAGGLPGDKEDE